MGTTCMLDWEETLPRVHTGSSRGRRSLLVSNIITPEGGASGKAESVLEQAIMPVTSGGRSNSCTGTSEGEIRKMIQKSSLACSPVRKTIIQGRKRQRGISNRQGLRGDASSRTSRRRKTRGQGQARAQRVRPRHVKWGEPRPPRWERGPSF